MELKWLEDFLSLATTRSFSRSAQERHVTQPAFSRRIRALEEWLGAQLIDRSVYPTALTPEGEAFREVAESVARRLYQAREETRRKQKALRATLSFAALHTISVQFFPEWLKSLEDDLGPLTTTVAADNLHDCVEAVLRGDCDFLLCYSHPDVPLRLDPGGFPSISIGSDAILPVSAPDAEGHPLHELPGDTERPLAYLSYTPDCFVGRLLELAVDRLGRPLHLNPVYQNSMAESLRAMALVGRGLAWLPHSSVRADLSSGALVRAGGSEFEIPVDVRLYRSRENSRPQLDRFWRRAASSSAEEGSQVLTYPGRHSEKRA